MPSQRQNTLQAGISVQRVLNEKPCPCTIISNELFVDRDFTNSPFVNLSLIQTRFLRCVLNHTNFTKSTLAYIEMNQCTASEGMTMSQATLTDFTIRDSILPRTVWIGAWLDNVTLIRSNLERANFTGGILRLVSLATETEITTETTTTTRVWGINCLNATLTESTFGGGVDFGPATFDNATLKNCHLHDAILSTTTWRGANLIEVQFEGAILGNDEIALGANFTGATLTQCGFNNALLTRVDFTDATLANVASDIDTDFSYSHFTNVTLAQSIFHGCLMNQCQFYGATVDHVSFLDEVDLTGASFHNATLTHVTMGQDTILDDASFENCEMDTVDFTSTTVDNLSFDNSTMTKIDFTGASLIAASFVAVVLTDMTFADAIMSQDFSEQSDELSVATTFEDATLTRIMVTGSAYLRFTIFTRSTIVHSQFVGTDVLDQLDMQECSIDDAVVSDTTFELCNLSYATFAGSTLTRVHFVNCSLSEADTTNVTLEYCTADFASILPENWHRDEDGWLSTYDPGPPTLEEEKVAGEEVASMAIFETYFREVGIFVSHEDPSGFYVVTWADDGSKSEHVTDLHHFVKTQGENQIFSEGSPVFVEYEPAHYVYGVIVKDNEDGTFDISYYAHVPVPDYVSRTQPKANIFLEFYEEGPMRKVGNFDNKYYRLIQTELDDGNVVWSDDTTTKASYLLIINEVQPQTVDVGTEVLVMIKSDSSDFDDNHYVRATVVAKLVETGMYQMEYVRPYQTLPDPVQSITKLYLFDEETR